jgi:hypothetical protein
MVAERYTLAYLGWPMRRKERNAEKHTFASMLSYLRAFDAFTRLWELMCWGDTRAVVYLFAAKGS